MILDQIFFGVLNENVGTLEVYDEPIEEVSWCRPWPIICHAILVGPPPARRNFPKVAAC